MHIIQRANQGSPLGQASAPAGPGPARRLAEQHSAPASSYTLSTRVRDSGKAYPGMVAYQPGDPSLYSLSARIPGSDKMALYVIEGPNVGGWKTLSTNDFQKNYMVVGEDEGIALRNLAPANIPVGDARMVDVVYPITLLSSAVVAIGETFPIPFDAAKAEDVSKSGLEGVLLATLLVNEALDTAGAAYDSLQIGMGALSIIRGVGVEMLKALNKIVGFLLKYPAGGSDVISKASDLASQFMSQSTYWGLLLDRAFLLTQSTNLNEMSRMVEDARGFDTALHAVLAAIDQRHDELIQRGLTESDLTAAKQYAAMALAKSQASEASVKGRIQSYLQRNNITEKDLIRSSLLMDKFLDANAEDIQNYAKKGSQQSLGSFLGNFLRGLAAGEAPGRVLPDQINAVDLARAGLRTGLSQIKAAPYENVMDLRPSILPALGKFLDYSVKVMSDVKKQTDDLRSMGLTEKNIPEVVKELRLRVDDLESKLKEAEEGEIPGLYSDYNSARNALRVAEMDSTLLDPKMIRKFMGLNELLVRANMNISGDPAAEKLPHVLELHARAFFGPKGRLLITDLSNPQDQLAFARFLYDYQRGFNVPANVMNLLAYNAVDRSLPGVESAGGPLSKSEAQKIMAGVAKNVEGIVEAAANHVNEIFPEHDASTLMSSYGSYPGSEEQLIRMVENNEGVFAALSLEQKEALLDYGYALRLENGLSGKAKWPEGIGAELKAIGGKYEFLNIKDLLDTKKAINTAVNKRRAAAANADALRQSLVQALGEARVNAIDRAIRSNSAINTFGLTPEQQKIASNYATARTDAMYQLELARKLARDVWGTKYKGLLGKTNINRVMDLIAAEDADVTRRDITAKATLADPNATPAAKDAADTLVQANDAANVANVDAAANIISYGALPENSTEPAPTQEETKNAVKIVAEAASTAERAENAHSGETGSPGKQPYPPDAVLPPSPTENPGPEVASPQGTIAAAANSNVKKTLAGVAALLAIGSLIGVGSYFLSRPGGKGTDPKPIDPIPPSPAFEDFLKIAALVGGVALLIYFLKKWKGQKEEEPKKKKKDKPALAVVGRKRR